jgi:hypothetical protein
MERRREVHGVHRLQVGCYGSPAQGVATMPFPLIPTMLAIGFVLVWVLIVGMLLRDGQFASRRERESQPQILPMPPARHHKKSRMRAAS